MIIVSITGPGMDEALHQMRTSVRHADMFEVRLDLIERPNIAALIASAKRPTIATCRPVSAGGAFAGRERNRIEMLELASVFGARYIDLELGTNRRVVDEFLRRKKETGVIVSHHQFDGPPASVRKIYSALRSVGADVVKLAYRANDAHENRIAIEFLALAKSDRQKAIAIAMGAHGEASRILYRKFGAWATFAAPEYGSAAAEGQLCASFLKGLFRSDTISPMTKVFGVVGNPVSQSKGIFVHNYLFKRARKNAVYCRFQVSDLKKFMRYISPWLSGFSVTIPHKVEIIKYVEKIDKGSRAIGAINTVIRRIRGFEGCNTDAPGALDAIEKIVKVRKKVVLVIGAGGAARAIAFEAKRRGARVIVSNRTLERAKSLALHLGIEAVAMSDVAGTGFNILVNATPVGMAPDAQSSPVPKGVLKDKVVFDVVYHPPMTQLLRDAQNVGATIIQGTEMYVHQAALQSTLFTRVRPPMRLMRRILEQHS